MSKTIDEIQKEVDIWVNQFEKPYFSPLSQLASITEELGEVARILNVIYGDKNAKDGESIKELEEELGDLFFCLVCIANQHNISLESAHNIKMGKSYGRDNYRFERKEENKNR